MLYARWESLKAEAEKLGLPVVGDQIHAAGTVPVADEIYLRGYGLGYVEQVYLRLDVDTGEVTLVDNTCEVKRVFGDAEDLPAAVAYYRSMYGSQL